MPEKLILKCGLSPGDIVTMTAAVRDLHAAYPGEYQTDVRTPCPALWEHNPHITRIEDDDTEARVIQMEYPLIHKSNQTAVHFLDGYREFLAEQLQRPIPRGEFKGDIHLSDTEKGWISQVEESGHSGSFWIIVAGGKRDFTAKLWETARWQQVVDSLKGRIQFVQVGEKGHNHPALNGVIDLRGKTDLRQLVRLVYHADGVLCGVTSLMHLAAAVPWKRGSGRRPCVVVAGGREPVQWEAYPGHQFLHTIGQLPCCNSGGCWKSRVAPLGDGEKHDASLCVRPVSIGGGGYIPECLNRITASDVIRAVSGYLMPVPAESTAPLQKAGCGGCGSGKTVTVRLSPERADRAIIAERRKICAKCEHATAPTARKMSDCLLDGEVVKKKADNPDGMCPAGKWAGSKPEQWGPFMWKEWHAKQSPDEAWLADFLSRLPCPECRADFEAILAANPPEWGNWPDYSFRVHNLVNAKLGKPQHEKPKPPVAGVVIGTYGAVPYIHLQLESLKRFHPGTPCLVVDDGSPQAGALEALCARYGAEFIGREKRMGHVAGDMQVFIEGHEWARRNGIGLLVKFSRRWVPIAPWLDELVSLWRDTGAPTLSNRCTGHGFGFRSECTAMDVEAWDKGCALVEIEKGRDEAMLRYVIGEIPVHQAAGRAWAMRPEALRNYQHVSGAGGYVRWPWMRESRREKNPVILWHETHCEEEYLSALRAFGIFNYSKMTMGGAGVIVRRNGALGDVLNITPIIRQLKLDGFAVDVATDYPEALRGNPDVRGVFQSHHGNETYDRVIDLNLAYERAPMLHIVDAYAEAAGVTLSDKTLYLARSGAVGEDGAVVIHCAKSWDSRTISQHTWQAVADALIARGNRIVVVGTKRDMTVDGAIDKRDALTLSEIAGVIDRAALFVGSDSALLHVAGTTGAPIVGIFTCVDSSRRLPFRNGELGWRARGVSASLDCIGCLAGFPAPVTNLPLCRRGDMACVRVKPDAIIDAAANFL